MDINININQLPGIFKFEQIWVSFAGNIMGRMDISCVVIEMNKEESPV